MIRYNQRPVLPGTLLQQRNKRLIRLNHHDLASVIDENFTRSEKKIRKRKAAANCVHLVVF